MARKVSNPMIFAGVIIVAMLIFGGVVISGLSGLVGGIGDWIKNGFDWTDLTGGSNSTESSLGFTVYYQDGTKKDFQSLSIFPLRISDGADSPVTKISLYLKIIAGYKGTVQSYSVTSNFKGELSKDGAYLTTLFDEAISQSGSSISNNAITTVWTKEITASQIESLYAGWTDGSSYLINFSLTQPVTLSLTFSEGKTESRTATVGDTVGWTFKYSVPEGLTSLSVSFVGTTS